MNSSNTDVEAIVQQVLCSGVAGDLEESAVRAVLHYYTTDRGFALEYVPDWYKGWELYVCIDDAADAKGIDRNGIWQSIHEQFKKEYGVDVNLDSVDYIADEKIEYELYRSFCVLQLDDSVIVKSRMSGDLPVRILYEGTLSPLLDFEESLHGDLPLYLKMDDDDELLFVYINWSFGWKKDGCEMGARDMITSESRRSQYDIYLKRSGSCWEYLCSPLCSEGASPCIPAENLQQILDTVEEGHSVDYCTVVSHTGEILHSDWTKEDNLFLV